MGAETTISLSDAHWMQRCLALATRGAGRVSPNPLVGAVLVSPDGHMLGEGWHARYGEAHAEVNAVADARTRGVTDAELRTATMYVSLEPCSHHGKTPPCADLLVRLGIPRVVVAHEDPFPDVAGRGLARLRAAGVDVSVGVLETEARRLNAAFLTHVATGRPYVVLKLAQTLDGCMATHTGHSQWITSPESRARVHALRATLDAVLIGAGTALADDPALTVRLADGRNPSRIVLDRLGTLPPSLRLFTDEHAAQTLVFVQDGQRPAYTNVLGDRLVHLPAQDGHLDLGAVLDALGKGIGGRRFQSVLVEAGPSLASAFLAHQLADEVQIFIAPKWLGGGQRASHPAPPNVMSGALTWPRHTWETVGTDVLLTAYKNA